MADNETKNEEILNSFDKMLKKYRMYFLSAVGILLVGFLLFTNYDLGSKLTGYIGPTETVQKPVIAVVTSPTEGGIVTLASSDPSIKFAWGSAIPEGDAATYKITQFNSAKLAVMSYEWQIKDKATGATIWELTRAYSGGVNIAEEDKICNIQTYDEAGKALDSGLDWTCPYVTIQYSQLKKDTDYTFSVRAYDGQTFSDYKTVTFKTKEAVVVTPPCTEGQKTTDGTLICKNGKWEVVTAVIQPDSTTEIVPELTVKTKTVTPPVETKTVTPPTDETNPELTVKTKTVIPPQDETKVVDTTKKVSTITLTKSSLSATTFNPLVNSLTFTIKTSADAKVDIKIYDKDGNIVASPANNKDVTGNKEYEVVWEGDNTAQKTLAAGAYSYKIFAKDPTTKEITDTKTGDITLKYGTDATKDFEALNGKTSGSTSATTTQTTQAVPKPSSSNAQAITAQQNATSGTTAGTGPETIIYLIFPILGYTVSRKFK